MLNWGMDNPLSKLPDSKLFERDVEQWDEEYLKEVEKRIAKASERLKARDRATGSSP